MAATQTPTERGRKGPLGGAGGIQGRLEEALGDFQSGRNDSRQDGAIVVDSQHQRAGSRGTDGGESVGQEGLGPIGWRLGHGAGRDPLLDLVPKANPRLAGFRVPSTKSKYQPTGKFISGRATRGWGAAVATI